MKNKLQKCRFSNLKSITAKVFLTFAVLSYSQQLFAQFTDDFSDGEFISDPAWSGDSTFIIESARLSLKAPPVTDTSYLATASRSLNDATWEFLVHLDFNPSTTNFARVYLVSDQPDLTGALNGYFVQVGNTADDVSLYRQSGTTITRIIDGTDGKTDLAEIVVKIKVNRDRHGTWLLYTDVGASGSFLPEGSISDKQHATTAFFGILCRYTSTRSDKFHFDNFSVYGDAASDITPPEVQAIFKDVIFTEIFADPSPSVRLPEEEFVEIFNRSKDSVNLNAWTLSDGSSSMMLLNVAIAPGEYVVITSNSSLFPASIKTLSSGDFPSLNNSDDRLILADANGQAIDSLHYSVDWYKDDLKESGGWSLELIDPENHCGEAENWVASEHPSGGTPGEQNSVLASNPDLDGPKLISAIPISSMMIRLVFDEKLQHEIPTPGQFLIEPGINAKIVSFSDASHAGLLIELTAGLSTGTLYSLTVNELTDCAGNWISEPFNHVNFGLPEDPVSSDVVVNEVLFDPRPGGVDFVEIVNVSSKFFNLKNWVVGNFENDSLTGALLISRTDFLFPPGSYLALTEDTGVLKSDYPLAFEANLFEVNDLPALNDDSGSIALASDNGVILDFFNYSKALHSVFINDPEGVSIERIALNVTASDVHNWKSAGTASGYATPGYINSNSRGDLAGLKAIHIDPEVFIPVSGQPDFVMIHYEFDHGGYVGSVRILDANGHHVKRLVNNEILGTKGAFRWDGDRDDGARARVGYYVICFEVFDDTGDVRTFFNRVAVATRF